LALAVFFLAGLDFDFTFDFGFATFFARFIYFTP
jgi:hypothetical protein